METWTAPPIMRLAYSDGEEQEPTSCPAAIHTHEWEGVIVIRLHLRAGRRDDARLLSELALRSKGYWGYDQAFLDACRAELTLTPEDVETRRVTVAERDGQVVGFYALAGEPPKGTLEDLFVEPDHIGTGVGRALWEHAIAAARTLGFARLTLEADPGAEPFYLAMGAHRIGTVPSGSIPGRVLPLLEVPIVGGEAR